MDSKISLSKEAKKSIELHLALLKDAGDWHHVYGLIEMAELLGLLTADEARFYKEAADQARKKVCNG